MLLAFGGSRISRIHESERRGFAPWVKDVRLGAGGARVAEVLKERGLARSRIGLVGFGPTAPGEMEGLLPLGFHANLLESLPDATIGDFTLAFTDFMLAKSAEEIALLRFAARVSEEACRVMMEAARPGVSEALVYAETVREIHRWGCDLRYPFFSLQSGRDNIAWGVPAGACALSRRACLRWETWCRPRSIPVTVARKARCKCRSRSIRSTKSCAALKPWRVNPTRPASPQ